MKYSVIRRSKTTKFYWFILYNNTWKNIFIYSYKVRSSFLMFYVVIQEISVTLRFKTFYAIKIINIYNWTNSKNFARLSRLVVDPIKHNLYTFKLENKIYKAVCILDLASRSSFPAKLFGLKRISCFLTKKLLFELLLKSAWNGYEVFLALVECWGRGLASACDCAIRFNCSFCSGSTMSRFSSCSLRM